MRLARRFRTVAGVATAAVALAACGGPTPVVEQDVPVAVAEPVPLEGSGLTAPPSAAPSAEASSDPADADAAPDADEAVEATVAPAPPTGPSAADAAAFVAGDAVSGLAGADHVVVDLDGDGWSEVVTTGTRERVGVVRVAWWTSGGYEVLASDEAGIGRDVIDLHAADLNEDDRIELLVVVEGEGRRSLAVWSVAGRGELERLEADGGCNDGRHVFGVTSARLQSNGEGPPTIVADCDESPLPVADWSDHRWVWQDGAFRHVEDDVDPGRGQGNRGGRGGNDDQGGGNDGDQGNGGGGPGDSDEDADDGADDDADEDSGDEDRPSQD